MKRRIAEVICDPEVEAKIRSKHNVTLDEVRESLIYVEGLSYSDAYNRNGEERVLVYSTTSVGRVLRVVLAVVDEREGIYALRTAF